MHPDGKNSYLADFPKVWIHPDDEIFSPTTTHIKPYYAGHIIRLRGTLSSG